MRMENHSLMILKWLVGSLFYDIFSVTSLYSVDGRVISEWWSIGRDLVESGHGLILRYYSGICLEGLRKTTNISSKIAGRWGRYLKPGLPE
jgi:hypothetical protein